MRAEWSSSTLGNALEFSNGRSSPERVENGDYQVFGSNGVIGYAMVTVVDPEFETVV